MFKRPDAEELRDIRMGAWTYERVCEFAEKEDQELSKIVKTSNLPSHPDIDSIHDMVFKMILEFNLSNVDGHENILKQIKTQVK